MAQEWLNQNVQFVNARRCKTRSLKRNCTCTLNTNTVDNMNSWIEHWHSKRMNWWKERSREEKSEWGSGQTESVDIDFVRNDHIEQTVAEPGAHLAHAAVSQAKFQRHTRARAGIKAEIKDRRLRIGQVDWTVHVEHAWKDWSTLIWPVGQPQPQFNTRNAILIKKAIFFSYGEKQRFHDISRALVGKQKEEEISINKKDLKQIILKSIQN